MREGEDEGVKHQMVSLSLDYITFGTGRYSWCVIVIFVRSVSCG